MAPFRVPSGYSGWVISAKRRFGICCVPSPEFAAQTRLLRTSIGSRLAALFAAGRNGGSGPPITYTATLNNATENPTVPMTSGGSPRPASSTQRVRDGRRHDVHVVHRDLFNIDVTGSHTPDVNDNSETRTSNAGRLVTPTTNATFRVGVLRQSLQRQQSRTTPGDFPLQRGVAGTLSRAASPPPKRLCATEIRDPDDPT